jgi:hypothetical protein
MLESVVEEQKIRAMRDGGRRAPYAIGTDDERHFRERSLEQQGLVRHDGIAAPIAASEDRGPLARFERGPSECRDDRRLAGSSRREIADRDHSRARAGAMHAQDPRVVARIACPCDVGLQGGGRNEQHAQDRESNTGLAARDSAMQREHERQP